MEKRSLFPKVNLLCRLPSPWASREALVGTPARSRPTTPLSTRSTDRNAKRGLATEYPLSNHDEDRRSQTINVVLFGEAGVGKSAVVNLIAQKKVAKVSSDVRGCTMASTRYDVSFDGIDFCLFDTVGLNQPDLAGNSHLEAIERAYKLIVGLQAAGGIHLLLFCMRAGKITPTTQSNYRLFVEVLCQKKVDVAVVVTCCEHEPVMDEWWTRNETGIERFGIKSVGHACVTAVTDGSPGEELKYEASQREIRELLKRSSKNNVYTMDATTWFATMGRDMKKFIKDEKTPTRKDIEKVLSKRLRLHQDAVKKIVDIMERSDGSPSQG